MLKRGPLPLTAAQLRQRKEAADASAQARQRHKGETSPSVVQGSSGPPSRRAAGLFAQGRARPDARGGRGVWDTRTSEPTVGRINANVTLHFPKAYRSETPDPKAKGKLLAQTLGQAKTRRRRLTPHQDVVVTNPDTVAEAHRHPEMRAILQSAVEVVRGHQKPTIDRGHERKMIPEGTRPSTVVQAYRHASLHALHKAGLIDYAPKPMDQQTKRALRPLSRFMFYAHRRVFDHLNQGQLAQKWAPFRQEFGQLYRQKKHGKLTGVERMRMRPHGDRFIKIEDFAELEKLATAKVQSQGMAKAWSHFSQLLGGVERGVDRPLVRTAMGGTGLGVGIAGYAHSRKQGKAAQAAQPLMQPMQPMQSMQPGQPQPGQPSTFPGQLSSFRGQPSQPSPAQVIPQIPTHLSIKDAAKHIEHHHFGIPPIGGQTKKLSNGLYRVVDSGDMAKSANLPKSAGGLADGGLAKYGDSFSLGSDYTTDPKRQLARAIHPRMRMKRFKLRLNQQRGLRRALSGGITRQERWLLGATTKTPSLKAESPGDMHKTTQNMRGDLRGKPRSLPIMHKSLSSGLAPHLARAMRDAKIFATSFKDTVRDHARVLAGGTPSPHQMSAARRIKRAAKVGGVAVGLGALQHATQHYRAPPMYQLTGAIAADQQQE